jgi:hypothetical protein
MGLIREPKNVDFFTIDNPWTDEEKLEFSDLIKREKSKLKSRRPTSSVINSTKRTKHVC